MTRPTVPAPAPGDLRASLDAMLAEAVPHWFPETRRDWLDALLAGPLKPILDAEAIIAARTAEWDAARAELERIHDTMAPLSDDGKSVWMDGTGFVPLDFSQGRDILDLARMYGEACGRLAEYRHAAVEWQQEQAEYNASCEAAQAAAEAQTQALQARVEGLEADAARMRAAIQAYLDSNYDGPHRHRNAQCRHGIWSWDTCENCIDEYFAAALDAQPTEQEASDGR